MNSAIEPYAACALQSACRTVNRCASAVEAKTRIAENIERVRRQAIAAARFIGSHTRLIVLPEYFLTGFPMGESIAQWRDKACIAIDGDEYRALGEIARDTRAFVSGNVYELDENFSELYFQTSFILDDQGEVILRYRRLLSMFSPTPHDVLTRYLNLYGEDSLFPVVDTPLGRLAAVASEEILYPEITRALAVKGAEVICHSSSEVGSPLATPKGVAKLARAHENHVFVVSANSAGVHDTDFPAHSTDGGSKLIDYLGRTLAEAGEGESMAANAEIHIEASRAWRRRPGMFNVFARQRLSFFAEFCARHEFYPANTMLPKHADAEVSAPGRQHFIDAQRAVIDKLVGRKVIAAADD